jgi:NTE family protein
VELSSGDVSEVVSHLLRVFDHVLVRLPDALSTHLPAAVDLCDAVIVFGPRRDHWTIRLGLSADKLWSQRIPQGGSAVPGFDGGRVARDRDRLARRIAGRRVGLALSSGGAHGLAHIGVLRVLEEARIPLDLIAGSSMGSVIAGVYAAGGRGGELYNAGQQFARMFDMSTGWRWWDVTLPRTGLMRGELVKRQLTRLTRGKRFEDCEIPALILAAEVVRGRAVVFQQGSLAAAIRASCSIPGVYEPVPYGDDFLVDGAAVEPVPCRPLAVAGADIIIASNVIPQVAERQYRGVHQRIGRGRPPGILDVFNSDREIMSAEIAAYKQIWADVVITPKVGMYSWLEGSRIDDFVRLGEEAARAALPQIQALLATGVRAVPRLLRRSRGIGAPR